MARGKIYFGQPTEDAIIEYNAEESPIVRNQIYNERIRKPLEKLVENIIHTFKFYYFDVPSEDVKHEVVSNLIINMHKYKQEKGRAFSYFSIVAKNYLILHNNNNYKKMKQQNDIQVADFERNIQNEIGDEKYQEGNSELLDFYCEYLENNISNIFTTKKYIDVAYSVLYLLQNLHNIENFNKKYLYLQIRVMTSSNTQHITRVITQLKKYFEEIKLEFYTKGEVDTSFTGSFFDA